MLVVKECVIVRERFMATVQALVENSETGEQAYKDLFSYYPDELSFDASDFVGRTEDEVHSIFHRADIAYLRS